MTRGAVVAVAFLATDRVDLITSKEVPRVSSRFTQVFG